MTDKPDTAAIRAQMVSRLTDWESCEWNHVIQLRKDAAATVLALCDEVDRLRAENERLREALRPFAAAADDYCDPAYDDDYSPRWAEFFAIGDFRRARAALAACKGVRDDLSD